MADVSPPGAVPASPLDALAAGLLVGTERRPPDWPDAPGALGALLARIAAGTDDPEIRALRIAGTLAVCADAAYLPPPASAPPPPICPPESRATVREPALAAALERILADGPAPLRAQALRRLATARRVLPPRLLPRILTLAREEPALRPLLAGTVGERGSWLAALNPDWSDALSPEESRPDPAWWETGTLELRCRYLLALRRRDPAAARERLGDGLRESDARSRLALLATLETGLCPEDEDLLESALKDRGKEVRRQAADLLARLPGSRYVARMGERLAACLAQERGLLGRHWTLAPPETLPAEWKQDALEEARAQGETLGPRAWLLYQLARALPLGWWGERTGMDPAACIRWAQGGDWSLALLRAWVDALARAPAPDWARALLERLPVQGLGCDPFELIALLPPTEREARWLRLLADHRQARWSMLGTDLGRIVQTLAQGHREVSAGFARQVLGEVLRALQSGSLRGDPALRRTLPELACFLPTAVLDEAARGLRLEAPELAPFAAIWAEALAVAAQRKTLIQHLSERTAP